jgi:hypothetical protein
MSTNKSCPVTDGWCWKNPVQVALLLALLPYAGKGLGWVWGLVCGLAAAAVK